jgi:hypothetical protein
MRSRASSPATARCCRCSWLRVIAPPESTFCRCEIWVKGVRGTPGAAGARGVPFLLDSQGSNPQEEYVLMDEQSSRTTGAPASLKPIGQSLLYLTCIIGHLGPIW